MPHRSWACYDSYIQRLQNIQAVYSPPLQCSGDSDGALRILAEHSAAEARSQPQRCFCFTGLFGFGSFSSCLGWPWTPRLQRPPAPSYQPVLTLKTSSITLSPVQSVRRGWGARLVRRLLGRHEVLAKLSSAGRSCNPSAGEVELLWQPS